MKKTFIILLTLTLMIVAVACGNTGKEENGKPDVDDIKTSEEEPGESSGGDVERVYMEAPEAGFEVPFPQSYVENVDKVFLYYKGYKVDEGLYEMYSYLYPLSYNELILMTEEENNKIEPMIINTFNLYRADASWTVEDLMEWISWNELKENPVITEVGRDGDYTIYLYRDTEISDALDEEKKAIYQAIVEELPECLDNIRYSEPVSDEEDEKITLSFTTKDVNGNDVTSEEIFGSAEYTMLNCWASWCGPCVAEMPEVEELSKKFLENGGQVIGVLVDGSRGGLEDGKQIIEETGVTYLNIVDWDGIHSQLNLQAVPITYFVDKSGAIVGQPIVGAAPDQYERRMNRLLEEGE